MSSGPRCASSTISRRCGRAPAPRPTERERAMRLLIAAVGRLKAGPERELLDRYVERANAAGRAVSLGPLEISEIVESQDRRPQDRMADEARKLDAAIPKGTPRIALDSGGRTLKSEDFAARLAALRDRGASG